MINLTFLAIIFAIFVSAAEIDICVPSFPAIQKIFELSAFGVEAILSINLFFHCISAVFVGYFGDRYGKKKVINTGFLIFTIGNILCCISSNYLSLMFGRILQGIGSAAPMVLAPLFIIQIYNKEKQEKMMNTLNGICTLAICLAPTIGSYATLFFDWRANFLILFILGIMSILFNKIYLPNEDIKSENQISQFQFKNYFIILKSKIPMMYILSCTIGIGLYYTFVAMAPLIYIKSLGVSLKHFGFYQGSLTLTFGVFSIFSGNITKFFGKKKSLIVSLTLILYFLLSSIFIIINNINNPLYITFTILFLSVGAVIPINFLYVAALNSIPNSQGKISAILTVLKWVFACIGIQAASYFYKENFTSTGMVMIIMEVISLALLFIVLRIDKNFILSEKFA